MKQIIIFKKQQGLNFKKKYHTVPATVRRAVISIAKQYQLDNCNPERQLDRKFEQLNPGAQVLYDPHRIVWRDERDYLLFTLRWS